jgi:hypothetical protein
MVKILRSIKSILREITDVVLEICVPIAIKLWIRILKKIRVHLVIVSVSSAVRTILSVRREIRIHVLTILKILLLTMLLR